MNNEVHIAGNPSFKALGPHVLHCFDFIRQALMCYGDMTLEPWVDYDGVTLYSRGSSGWGTTHKCRNFEELKGWVEEQEGYRKADA